MNWRKEPEIYGEIDAQGGLIKAISAVPSNEVQKRAYEEERKIQSVENCGWCKQVHR